MKNGKLIEKYKDWREARKIMEEDITHLSDASKRLLNPQKYKVSISKSLHELRTRLIEQHVKEA